MTSRRENLSDSNHHSKRRPKKAISKRAPRSTPNRTVKTGEKLTRVQPRRWCTDHAKYEDGDEDEKPNLRYRCNHGTSENSSVSYWGSSHCFLGAQHKEDEEEEELACEFFKRYPWSGQEIFLEYQKRKVEWVTLEIDLSWRDKHIPFGSTGWLKLAQRIEKLRRKEEEAAAVDERFRKLARVKPSLRYDCLGAFRRDLWKQAEAEISAEWIIFEAADDFQARARKTANELKIGTGSIQNRLGLNENYLTEKHEAEVESGPNSSDASTSEDEVDSDIDEGNSGIDEPLPKSIPIIVYYPLHEGQRISQNELHLLKDAAKGAIFRKADEIPSLSTHHHSGDVTEKDEDAVSVSSETER